MTQTTSFSGTLFKSGVRGRQTPSGTLCRSVKTFYRAVRNQGQIGPKGTGMTNMKNTLRVTLSTIILVVGSVCHNMTAYAPVSDISAHSCTNSAEPPLRPLSATQKNKPSTVLSSDV